MSDQRRIPLHCFGRNETGGAALETAIEATVVMQRSPGQTGILSYVECPHNTGGHGQRCKASHPPGQDKVGDGVACPFTFAYPRVADRNPAWQAPTEVSTALSEMTVRAAADR